MVLTTALGILYLIFARGLRPAAAIAVAGMLILYLVQRTGMSPLACCRALRVAYLGRRRETRSNEIQWRKRCRW